MKILVTGAAGYIGSILCDHLLRAGHRVTVLDNLMYEQRSLFYLCAVSDFDFVFGDARDESLMAALVKNFDVIIPLAAVVGAGPMPRSEVVSKLWIYIKKNNLQDEKNRRNINGDAALKKVFGGKATVNMFEMTKLVSKHLS